MDHGTLANSLLPRPAEAAMVRSGTNEVSAYPRVLVSVHRAVSIQTQARGEVSNKRRLRNWIHRTRRDCQRHIFMAFRKVNERN